MAIPLDPKDPKQGAGPLTRRINESILDIQHGVKKSNWSVVV